VLPPAKAFTDVLLDIQNPVKISFFRGPRAVPHAQHFPHPFEQRFRGLETGLGCRGYIGHWDATEFAMQKFPINEPQSQPSLGLLRERDAALAGQVGE